MHIYYTMLFGLILLSLNSYQSYLVSFTCNWLDKTSRLPVYYMAISYHQWLLSQCYQNPAASNELLHVQTAFIPW